MHVQYSETAKAHTIRSFWKRRIALSSSARFSSCSPNRWSRKAFTLPRCLYSCNSVFFLCNCQSTVLNIYWMAFWPQMPKSCSSYTLLNLCKWKSSLHNLQVRRGLFTFNTSVCKQHTSGEHHRNNNRGENVVLQRILCSNLEERDLVVIGTTRSSWN
jgi:hypothetical protein